MRLSHASLYACTCCVFIGCGAMDHPPFEFILNTRSDCILKWSPEPLAHRQNKLQGVAMTISMLDQMLFHLSCRHEVVLGRLEGRSKWTCEQCGKETSLISEPFKTELVKDLDTAIQIDLQNTARGE